MRNFIEFMIAMIMVGSLLPFIPVTGDLIMSINIPPIDFSIPSWTILTGAIALGVIVYAILGILVGRIFNKYWILSTHDYVYFAILWAPALVLLAVGMALWWVLKIPTFPIKAVYLMIEPESVELERLDNKISKGKKLSDKEHKRREEIKEKQQTEYDKAKEEKGKENASTLTRGEVYRVLDSILREAERSGIGVRLNRNSSHFIRSAKDLEIQKVNFPQL